ncbi:MAG: PSD1 and planctomycete cytochrome C domain-containing protein [Chthoniobacteraceae bacterium]
MIRRAALIATALTLGAHAGEKLAFNRDVRPILSDKCFACHGPDAAQRKGKLRLDQRDAALTGGESGAAFVPGKPDESEVMKRIVSTDRDEVMPPPKAHKALTAAQRETLRRWISEGAEYEPHWAFIAPKRAELPPVKNAAWVKNAVDRFILARLEREGLTPSPEADVATLIRRVTLDLTGLPPTPEEVNTFLGDTGADAYERLVERLLASPRYGERMAIDWLDAARFADSNGYQVDRDRELWPWRDWVIRAFNENKPFDQFTIEQIAGDLLPNATRDQRIATGFHRNHMMNEEGGIIAEEFLAEYTADRVETTATVWLAQTFNCARCHDHKYDPFTQRDFYAMKAFFHNVSEKGIGSYGSPIRINAPPFLRLPTDEQTKKLATLDADIAAAKKQLVTATAEANSGTDEWAQRLATTEMKWTPGEFVKVEAGKALVEVRPDGARIEAPNPGSAFTANCSVRFSAGRATALKIECADAGMSGTARWLDVRVFVGKQQLKLRAVESGDSIAKAELTKTLDGAKQTFTTVAPREAKSFAGVFEFAEPIAGTDLRVVIDAGYGSGPMLWRIATTGSDPELFAPSAILALAKKDAAKRTPAEKKRLADFHAQQSPALRALDDRITALTQQRDKLDREVQTTLVMEELPQPRQTFVLMRGAYDKPGDEVTAATPATLPSLAADAPRNRLGLARWLVDPANPLPARVTVNRLWQSVFGAGLVKTAEDFGAQGEAPSHLELLDWLAMEFVHTGWDVKAMMRLVVTSATYRQSSRLTAALHERDPENRLLARGPRFRLAGEAIRDQALAASGLLVGRIGGPSVKPYHPPGLYEQVVAGSSAGTYVQGKGDELHRRSLYTYWKRSVPNPAMLTFDAPFRETCTVRRPRTNTPLQALNLMNDPTYVEAARFLAQRMMREGGESPESRIARGFQLVLARAPKSAELAVLTAAYVRALGEFRSDAAGTSGLLKVGEATTDTRLDAAQLAALTTVASTILNLDETVTKE